jgi:TonB family protein
MNHLGPTLRRTRRRERPGWRTLTAIVLSLLVNFLIVTQLDASWLGIGKLAEVRPVEMTPLTAGAWEANRQVTDGSRPPPPPNVAPRPVEPPPQIPDTLKAPGQVVDVAPSQNDAAPKESKYVSDRNNTVEKETRSRFARAGYAQTLPVPSAAANKGGAQKGDDGKDETSKSGKVGDKGVEGQKLAMAKAPSPTSDPLPPGAAGEQVASQAQQAAQQAATEREAKAGEGEGGLRKSGKYDPRLAISSETFAKLLGGPAPDHLANVEEGDGTYLNTREWKYATYMNRIKQAVASNWNPQRVLEDRDPDRNMYAFKDRYTLLAVTLDEAGGVKNLSVAKTSGVDFIDQTAVEAFKKAQPFVNPPRGIVENGEIRFSFGFYLEVGRAGLRVFRNQPTPP